ncbi:phosphatidylinositol 3-kinase VPS34-like isoform X2 [Schistocerca gregaria]|uniref:phosphatidylinositol 3-kinase VPS34-like isoform X2 n=1 Tax=Schistocerca gregaria TaxID=7010 RepID=UPI00211E4332|nr:phosphatidylinositol 3-kinase VPS34-like isoform X2 [Schistocerca gregaria]
MSTQRSQTRTLPAKKKSHQLVLSQSAFTAYFRSCDVDLFFRFKVVEDGDFYVSAQLCVEGIQVCPSVNTGFGRRVSTSEYDWNEVLSFPVEFKHIPLSTQIVLTVVGISPPGVKYPVGGTAMPLFDEKCVFRQGYRRLMLWPNRAGDGAVRSTTPGLLYHHCKLEEVERQVERYFLDREHVPEVEWLDCLASQTIERINISTDEYVKNRHLLSIEMAKFRHPLLFHQPSPPEKGVPSHARSPHSGEGALQTAPAASLSPEVGYAMLEADPKAAEHRNPVEIKRSFQHQIRKQREDRHKHITKTAEYYSKPSSGVKTKLSMILEYPPLKPLSPEEKNTVWTHRYYLRRNPGALSKFLRSVNWQVGAQAEEAYAIMHQWESISVGDALELLSKPFSAYPKIRSFAVRRLESSTYDEISDYLPQLVQALQYDRDNALTDESGLLRLLIRRAVEDEYIGNFFFWHLLVECDALDAAPEKAELYSDIHRQFMSALSNSESSRARISAYNGQKDFVVSLSEICTKLKASRLSLRKKTQTLKSMLLKGGSFESLLSFDQPIPLPLDPKFSVTGVHPDIHIFNSTLMPLKLNLNVCGGSVFPLMFKMGDDLRQDQFVIQLISLMDKLLKKENLDLKLTPYRILAASRSVGMIEIVPHSINIADVLKYFGDIISYMRYYNAQVTSTPGTDDCLKKGLHSFNYCINDLDTYGIDPVVLNNFVRSCAGYCVITYILGVGDRHLDNLLITRDGKLFHIDFGFILGRDPKPFPPPMKLCREMVLGMGGKESVHYELFKSYACEAYNILRKSAYLILNLCSLMVDSDLKDFAHGERAALKVQEKLKLDYTDEEACLHMENLIAESVKAIVAPLIEVMHSWAKYWRS